jgi:ABC-type Na+ efflux pump permease subunit
VHSSKPDAASAVASSGYDMSATIEPTGVKAASSSEVATTKSSSAGVSATKSTAMASSASAAAAASHCLTHCGKQNYAN